MLRSEAGDDPERMAAVLRGVRAYQRAGRRPLQPRAPIVARIGRATLRDYGGAGGKAARPIVFIPSIINSADILDLDADRSMLRWLVAQGLRPMLLEWGKPSSREVDCSLGGHAAELIVPLLAGLEQPPVLVGYCLGGTLAIAAAALARPHALCMIATPWHFTHYAEETRQIMLRLWEEARGPARTVGLLPMEVLQAAFWQIDAERTLGKFAAFGQVADDAAAVQKFVAVEDWANDGPPMPYAAAEELFEGMLRDDRPGQRDWRVENRTIDPAAFDFPMLEIVSTTDRIVPAAAAAKVGERIETGLGHVGMIVGGRARETIWAPLADWLRRVG